MLHENLTAHGKNLYFVYEIYKNVLWLRNEIHIVKV